MPQARRQTLARSALCINYSGRLNTVMQAFAEFFPCWDSNAAQWVARGSLSYGGQLK